MAIVSDLLTTLDNSVGRAGQSLFENTATLLGPIVTVVMSLMIVTIGIGMALGAQISTREGVGHMLRIVLVFLFGLSWANFNVIYDALTNGLQNLGFSMFATLGTGLSEPTATAAMDGFGEAMTRVTDEVISAQSSITRGLVAGILMIFMGLLYAVYILTVGFAKIMIAFLVAVAPLAILATLFDKTKNLFEAWLASIIGYALWPVAAGAVIATVVLALDSTTIPDREGTTFAAMLAFFVLVFVAIFAIMAIPQAVSNMTGQINLANLGVASGVVGGAAGAVAGRTGGQFLSGMFRGGKSRQQARIARIRACCLD